MTEGYYITMREFSLGAILSLYTGILCAPSGMDGLYRLSSFMTGDSVMTHQLPRIMDEARPYLEEQMPWLREIDADRLLGKESPAEVERLVAKYGKWHTVRPMHPEDHAQPSLTEELREVGFRGRVSALDAETGEWNEL